MQNKPIWKILAISIVLLIFVSSAAPSIAVDDSTNNKSYRLDELPLYNAAIHVPHPLQFDHKFLRDDSNRTKIISEQHLTHEHKLKKLSVSEKGASKSNYTFSLHGNVKLLWSYVNDERDAEVDFNIPDDVNGDGIDDILVSDCNLQNKLLVISSKDGSVIWSKNYPPEIVIEKLLNLNGDGIDDILVSNCNSGNKSLAISGKDGSVIWSKNYPTKIEIDGLDDVNGDGIEDAIVFWDEYDPTSNQTNITIELLSGSNGEKIGGKEISYEGEYWIGVHGTGGDISGDGTEDILIEARSWGLGITVLHALNSRDFSTLWKRMFNLVSGYHYAWNDLTGDEINDFAVSSYNRDDNTGELYVIRGFDGSTEWHKSFIGDVGYSIRDIDFDRDGLKDIEIEINDFKNNAGKFFILTGTDGLVIWSKSFNYRVWWAPWFSDFNGDGIEEVCLELRNFITHRVEEVHVLSGIDGSLIWKKDVNVSQVGYSEDLNGDGKMDLLFSNSTEIEKNKYLYEVIAISGVDGNVIWKSSFSHDFEIEISVSEHWYQLIGWSDLNGDGITDPLLEIESSCSWRDENASTYRTYYMGKLILVNGKDGSEIGDAETMADEYIWFYEWCWYDFNNDGINDVLLGTGKGVYLLTTTETPVNQPPIASFTYSPPDPTINQTITFNASSSYDPDGNIINYKWNFGEGNSTNTSEDIITYSYISAGDYTVNLAVTDNEGATDSISKTVSVSLGELLDVPFFSQRDPAWCDKKLDYSPYSIREYGCALTSAAMVAKYFGCDTDPDKLNTSLTEVRGLDASGILYWEKVDEVSGGKVDWIGGAEGNWSKINQELSNKNPVIANVSCSLGNHFIVFIGKIGSDYYFLDPYDESMIVNKWPNGAHGEYTLNNLRIYHRGRQQLVEAIEELELAILDSIDYDVQQVADSYALLATAAELTPWWRELARLALDTIHAVVGTVIEVGEFLTPKGANQVLEDPSTCQQVINGVKKSKDILGGIAAFQGLAGLYRNADSYKLSFEAVNTVEEVARQEYEVSEDFDRTANAAWLELWRPSTPNGLLIPLKTEAPLKEGSRSSVSFWVNGLKDVREEVKNSFDDVINKIPDPLPADYPLAETITYLKNLKQQIRGGGYRVVEFKGVEDDKERKRHITLGMVQEGREATSLLYTAWMDDLDVQYTSTLHNTGETIMHVTTYGIPATGVTKKVAKGVSDLYEVIDIIQLPSDLVNLIDKPVHPLDALQYHIVKMNNDLVHETSNLWTLADGTLKYLQYTWTP